MSDLISRQAALDEIDRARVGLIGLKMLGAEHILVRYGRRIIEEQPTIDAVPVVRCKDCKHRPIDTGGHNYGQDLFFPDEDECPCQCGDQWYSWMPSDDWFCPNGERKTDD